MATVVTVITGAYPTDTPTVLGATTAIELSRVYASVDVMARVTAATGTVTLLAWHPLPARWFPVGDVTLDSTVDGGMALGRFAVGTSDYSHVAVWEKTAGATIAAVHLAEMRR